jgi:hypothetical protein
MRPHRGATSDTARTVPGANQSNVLGNTSSDKPAEKTNQALAKSWRDWLRAAVASFGRPQ